MIKVNNIGFHYSRSKEIFRAINLTLERGQVVGLYGESGLGKTTLATIIAGYNQPSSGAVYIDEQKHPIRGRNPVQLIWQHPEKAVNPRWRMEKMLSEAGHIDMELLDSFKIKKEWLYRYPSELSGGELQRFCVVRALHPNTKYIIADEMTTMLDAFTQAQIWQALLGLAKKRNIGILAISHNQELLQEISDRTVNFNTLVYNSFHEQY